jgi:hypothetical protein
MVQSTDMFPATEAAKSDPIPATDRRTMSAVGMSSRNVPDEQPGASFGGLAIEVGRAEGRVVVRVRGDLDVHSAPRLRRTLADLIGGQGTSRLLWILPDWTLWTPPVLAYWSAPEETSGPAAARLCFGPHSEPSPGYSTSPVSTTASRSPTP